MTSKPKRLAALAVAVLAAAGPAACGKSTTTPTTRPSAAPPAEPAGSPPRQVTSTDFIREFKAFYNPVQPVGAPFYYNATIAGLTAYDNAETKYFASKAHKPTATNISNFQNTHTISGITAPNSSTLQIKLKHPAADFLYMMAMPFSSARPVEYDKYVPGSAQFNQHTMSDGPYQITSVVPGKSLVMTDN